MRHLLNLAFKSSYSSFSIIKPYFSDVEATSFQNRLQQKEQNDFQMHILRAFSKAKAEPNRFMHR